ncbi:MAG: nitroreductase family protein [Moorellaceae bacterium]
MNGSDVITVMKTRRSIRRFKPESVPELAVHEVLEAACLAPSAGNIQPWFFYVIYRAEIKEALSRAAFGQRFVAEAPVVIAVCADLERAAAYGDRGRTLYCLQDTAAAVSHILLAATAQGLGTCWVGAFNEEEVRRVLALPAHLRPVALVPLGYPAQAPSPRPRRPVEEVSKILK